MDEKLEIIARQQLQIVELQKHLLQSYHDMKGFANSFANLSVGLMGGNQQEPSESSEVEDDEDTAMMGGS